MHSLKKVKAIVFLVAVIIYAIIFTAATSDKDKRVQLLLDQETINLEHNFKVTTNHYRDIAKTINYEVFQDTTIVNLFHKAANTKNENDLAVIRKKLYNELKSHFNNLSSVGVSIMQFVFKDNTSFLRLHKPSIFADDLTTVRYSIDYVNSNKRPISGFERGRVSHAFRNVFPVFLNNEYLGAVDLSFSSDHMQENMLLLHNTDTHFIVDKSVFKPTVYKTLRNIKYTQSIEHEDFLFAITPSHSREEHNAQKDKINKTLKKEIYEQIKHTNKFSLFHHEGDSAYIISFLPIKNIKDQKRVAYLVSYTKNDYLEGMLHVFVWLNIISIASILVISILTYSNIKHRYHLESQITDRTKDLEKEKSIAEKATKSKSQFLANMSHEIRTPMNGILGMSHLLQQTELNTKQSDFLEKIDESAKSLLGIINDILDFSKIEAGKMTIDKINFNLQKSINRVIKRLEFKAHEKDLEINLDYDSKIGNNFYGDKLRITQILTNLLSNAIKFTDNGKIDIIVSGISNGKVKFEVKDTGIGLSEKQKDKLFKSFSQADGSTTRKYGGTGLGLAISKQLVELMNGRIWVKSRVASGSSFIFEIELQATEVEEEVVDKKSDKIELKCDNLINNKLLIVEDNLTNQLVLLGLLEDSNCEIDIANNGQEAVDMFIDNSYELILMDLQMPVMDGYEATKIIRGMDKNIPIIALTANAMKDDVEKTMQAGMNEHLTKPLNVKELFDTLRKYIKSD